MTSSDIRNLTAKAGMGVFVAEDGKWYYNASDGKRVYTLASTADHQKFEVRSNGSYPENVDHIFDSGMKYKTRLTAAEFEQLWGALIDETERLGYPAAMTAPAMLLYHEGIMMQHAHRNRRAYSMADCLKIIATWRPHFDIQQLGIMIDLNMSLDMILDLPDLVAFEYVEGLYPSPVRS